MELYICFLYIPSLRRQGQLYFGIAGELKNLFMRAVFQNVSPVPTVCQSLLQTSCLLSVSDWQTWLLWTIRPS